MMAYSRHSSIKSKHSDIGGLCLIDETGAYPVRAHCLGGGFMTIRSKSSDENVLVADFINGKLLELWNRQESLDLPYFDISARESLSIIINLLSSTTSMDSNDSPTVLRRKARLELAIVDVSRKRLIRKRVRDISSL